MTPRVYRFRGCRIDLSARELRCAGVLATLSPKVFDCLAYLIEHRNRAIGRDELIAAVWGRVDVSDTLLGQTVLKARRAIGDTGNEQHAIRTVPRFGYRWVAESSAEEPPSGAIGAASSAEQAIGATLARPSLPPPEEMPATKAASPTAASRPLRRHAALLSAIAIVIVIALAAGEWRLFAGRDGNRMASLTPSAQAASDTAAVMPVEFASQGDWSWLRLGLMDLIANRLRSAGLAVVPSDNVVALLHNGGDDAARAAKTIVGGTGARVVVLPTASRVASEWVVRLSLHAADGSQRDVEARSADVIEAGRAAADRLLALLGKRAPGSGDEARDLPASEMISRAEAALLTDDLAGARHLLESAPAAVQQSPELRLRLAQIDFRAGQLDAARTRLDVLLGEVSAESNPVLRARILNGSGVVDIRTEHHAEAERKFTEAIGLLESRNQPAALGQAYTGRAVSYAARGRYDSALADFSRARIALELAGDTLALARVEENEGIVSTKRGRYAEALAAHQHSAQRFERFGALNELAGTLANAANTQRMLLLPADALATTERAWSLVGRLENPRTRRALQVERAAALAENGRLTEARALLADLAAAAIRDPDALLLARIHLEQATLDFGTGRFDGSAALAASATAVFDNEDYQRERANAWLLLTRALRAQGKNVDAAAETVRLRAWAKDRPAPPIPASAALASAENDWAERRRDASYTAYDEALALAEKVGVPADTAEVVISYGASLIADGELERASAIVGQVARWSDHDFDCALLQVRYYRALGEHDAWQSALQRARSLAGERTIPPLLMALPGAADASSSVARTPWRSGCAGAPASPFRAEGFFAVICANTSGMKDSRSRYGLLCRCISPQRNNRRNDHFTRRIADSGTIRRCRRVLHPQARTRCSLQDPTWQNVYSRQSSPDHPAQPAGDPPATPTEITRMSSKIGNTLSVAIGAAFIGSLSLSQLAAASPAFQASDLAAGYMLAAAGEGKCGEGKCGVAKLDTNKDGKVSMAEATAGGFSESQVKAWDKNGDGMLDATELASMHATMDKGHMMDKDHKKGAEGSCGGDKKAAAKKGAEGSCGGARG